MRASHLAFLGSNLTTRTTNQTLLENLAFSTVQCQKTQKSNGKIPLSFAKMQKGLILKNYFIIKLFRAIVSVKTKNYDGMGVQLDGLKMHLGIT